MVFSAAILAARRQGRIPVIADIKCRSPQHGDLLRGRDPVACAEALVRVGGAPALSVVTEAARFGGSLALLERIVKVTGVPVLRKDFIETEEELARTRDAGASAILLMVSVLPEATLEMLYAKAPAYGLEVLVEVHTEAEMEVARRLAETWGGEETPLIGINNRDITQWECDHGTVETTKRLVALVPSGATLISESGMTTPADAHAAIRAGCTAALVGTALWQAPDLCEAYKDFTASTLGRSPKINSVGQRPTNDPPQNHKPCKGEIKEVRISPLQGCDDFSSCEGRCPSLLIEGLRPNEQLVIKICGLTSEVDIQMCLRHGIRHLGFVVEYPETVPWNLTCEEAKALLATVPEGVETYVVCGGLPETILRLARELAPTAIQIHHRETPEDVAAIIAETKPAGIKAYRAVSPETSEDDLAALCAMPDLAGLVADSRTPDNAAQHGHRLDLAFYARLRARFPRTIFLGGGITPGNVREILDCTQAEAVDILTGVESSPRHKDEAKLKKLCNEIT